MPDEEPEEEMWREREKGATDERWNRIQSAFGKRNECRVCGARAEEHDGKNTGSSRRSR